MGTLIVSILVIYHGNKRILQSIIILIFTKKKNPTIYSGPKWDFSNNKNGFLIIDINILVIFISVKYYFSFLLRFLYISIPFRIIDVEIDNIVKIVTGFITTIPTATGVSIFDAAIKVSLSILLNITQLNHLGFLGCFFY